MPDDINLEKKDILLKLAGSFKDNAEEWKMVENSINELRASHRLDITQHKAFLEDLKAKLAKVTKERNQVGLDQYTNDLLNGKELVLEEVIEDFTALMEGKYQAQQKSP